MGDVWEDANLLGPLIYAKSCKHCRTSDIRVPTCLDLSRIPEEWRPTMDEFVAEYETQCLGDPVLRQEYCELLSEGSRT